MATSSFDRDFIVKDKKAWEKLMKEAENPIEIKVKKKWDYDKDNKKGLKLLKKSLSI